MLIPSLLEMIAMAQHISKPSVWPWSPKVQGSPVRAELGLAHIARLSRARKLGSRRAVRALPRAAPCASLHLSYGKAREQPLHAERQLWLPCLAARMETASYGV